MYHYYYPYYRHYYRPYYDSYYDPYYYPYYDHRYRDLDFYNSQYANVAQDIFNAGTMTDVSQNSVINQMLRPRR